MCDINHVISQLKLFKRTSPETDRLIRNVVKSGNLENVRKIAELGDFVKDDALFFASSEGNIACLNMLIEMGADVNGTVIEFNDDIGDSHEENDNDDRGSGDENDVNKNDDDDDDEEEEEEKEGITDHNDECWKEEEVDDYIVGDSLLMFTLKNSKQQLKIAQILIEAGADVNVSNQHGETALMESAFTGNIDCLDLLINSGADVNKADKRGNTPLLLSAVQGHYNCLELLLQRGAHVNNDDNSHAILAACREGQYRCVDALLTAGANVNSTWRGGKTALMEATHVELQAEGPDECKPSEPSSVMDKGKCLHLLLASGADVNTRCDAGSTALMHAADTGQEHLTDILIKAGADVKAVDKENETALTKAEKNGHKECVDLLLGAGADVNMIGPNRRTATMSAEHQVHSECVKALADAEADVNK